MLKVSRPLLVLGVLASLAWLPGLSDPRIESRVDPRIRAEVAAVTDSLIAEGLRPEPLIDYALEGTEKRGKPELILAGVRRWAADLRRARDLLGPQASPAEVNAGAEALRAGASVDQLKRFRNARLERRYDVSLNTVAFLIKRGVPADTASTLVVNLTFAGANDIQLRELQDAIERDILAGTPAGPAAVARAAGLLDTMNSGAPDGVTSGRTLPSTRGTGLPADPMSIGGLRGSAVGNKGELVRPPAPRGKDSKRP